MKVFVTGASGWVGSAVVQKLLEAGHQVLGLARSEANAKKVEALGAQVHRGSLEDLESIKRGAAQAEGVVHTAYNHDFVNVPRDVAAVADKKVIDALGSVLAGTQRPLIITSGMARLETGQPYTELDAAPAGPVSREVGETAALSFVPQGVRAMVVRLPPSVHGDGDHGLVPSLVTIAREKKVSAYIGEGQNRWPAVHRFDAAQLYRLALENGKAGARYHAIGEEGVPTRAIAEAIGRGLKLPVEGHASPEHFGWLGYFFGSDVKATAKVTEDQLGWKATGLGLVADLDRGVYFR